MRQTQRGFSLPTLLSITAALTTLLLIFLGTVAYWRLESLVWASYRQTQIVLDSLAQRTEGLDGEMAAALQELEALKREQEAMRSRIEALEAEREQIADCRLEISNLQSEISHLNKRLDDLPAIREDLAAIEEDLQRLGAASLSSPGEPSPGPASLGVPLYKQSHNLSCEAASASMVAAFFGVPLSEEEAIAALPRHENPNLGFRGNLDGLPGGLEDYGVHAAPIQKLLAEYGLRVTNVEGGLEGIRNALKAGHPVMAWITYHLWEQTPTELELAGGAKVKVVPYEHTVVIEGYTDNGLWALDPYDGERQLLPWVDFERSWRYLDQMALQITGP